MGDRVTDAGHSRKVGDAGDGVIGKDGRYLLAIANVRFNHAKVWVFV